jgi:signal transduction histidine kinase
LKWLNFSLGQFDVRLPFAVTVVIFCYTLVAQTFRKHKIWGRWAFFLTLLCDLAWLSLVIVHSGGMNSLYMAGLPVMSLFFAILFRRELALLPPLLVLPLVVISQAVLQDGILWPVLVAFSLFFAVLLVIVLYVTGFVLRREERANREMIRVGKKLKRLAILEERARLSQEIHDGVGGALSAVIIQSEYLLTLVGNANDALAIEIAELKIAAEEAMDEMRHALMMMHKEFDLLPQLGFTCQQFQTRYKIATQLLIEGKAPKLSHEQQLAVFRILGESLVNAARHADATEVKVKLRFFSLPDGTTLSMEITDNGKGFDATQRPFGHYGLQNMESRAEKVGGWVEYRSMPDVGTKVLFGLKVPFIPDGNVHLPIVTTEMGAA